MNVDPARMPNTPTETPRGRTFDARLSRVTPTARNSTPPMIAKSVENAFKMNPSLNKFPEQQHGAHAYAGTRTMDMVFIAAAA